MRPTFKTQAQDRHDPFGSEFCGGYLDRYCFKNCYTFSTKLFKAFVHCNYSSTLSSKRVYNTALTTTNVNNFKARSPIFVTKKPNLCETFHCFFIESTPHTHR